jgi:hypothetical protein
MQVLPDIAANGDLVYAINELRTAAAAADEEVAHLREVSIRGPNNRASDGEAPLVHFFDDRPTKLAQYADAARDNADKVSKLVGELLAKLEAI